MHKKQRIKGFTLLELMIVVAVIGILAAIAYPSYARYIERGYLADAHAELVDINNVIKTKRVKDPSALATLDDIEGEAKALFKDADLTARYDIKAVMPDKANSTRYNLVVKPKANSGLALWMSSTGEAYRCQSATAATAAAAAKQYKTDSTCEKIGG